MSLKDWIAEKFQLESDADWWGIDKLITKTGKIDWWKIIRQQLLLHPFYVAGTFVWLLWPEWWTVLVASVLYALEHEWTQFLSHSPQDRNPNLIERGLDVCGFIIGGQMLYWGWVLIPAWIN
jgi:hypothetical protein